MSVFINTKSEELPKVSCDCYNVGSLIKLCNDPNVILVRGSNKNPVVDHVCFFVRTATDNKIIVNTTTNKTIFEANANDSLPEGVTLNDYMLINAREFLVELYKDYSALSIVKNSCPTPYGITQRPDGTLEALFQIVVNHLELKDPTSPHAYVNVEDHYSDFDKAYKQFIKTKEV